MSVVTYLFTPPPTHTRRLLLKKKWEKAGHTDVLRVNVEEPNRLPVPYNTAFLIRKNLCLILP